MSKEFRAFDTGNKIMHYDFQFIKSGNEDKDWIIFTSDKQTLKDQQHPDPFHNPYSQRQFKIMEYSGLVDWNGVKIFEGDYVKLCNTHITGKNEGYSDVFFDGKFWQPFSYLNNYIGTNFEVIGNIYEPEPPWNKIKLMLEFENV